MTDSDELARLEAENLRSWQTSAEVHAHGTDRGFYRIDEFLAGESTLSAWERDELGDVTDKRLVHLCVTSARTPCPGGWPVRA